MVLYLRESFTVCFTKDLSGTLQDVLVFIVQLFRFLVLLLENLNKRRQLKFYVDLNVEYRRFRSTCRKTLFY